MSNSWLKSPSFPPPRCFHPCWSPALPLPITGPASASSFLQECSWSCLMGVSHRVQIRAHRKHWGNTREERGWPPSLLLTLPGSASFPVCLPKRCIPLQFQYTSCSLPQTPIQEFSLHQFISPEGCIPLTLGIVPAFDWLCLSLRKTVPVKNSQGARFSHRLTDNAQHPKDKAHSLRAHSHSSLGSNGD